MRPTSCARSSSASTISWIRPRISSTTRGVKALLTRARRRVWSGGSRKGMEGSNPASPNRARRGVSKPFRPKSASRSMPATSSWRARTQSPLGTSSPGSWAPGRGAVLHAVARFLVLVVDDADHAPRLMIVRACGLARPPDDRRHVEAGRAVEHVAAARLALGAPAEFDGHDAGVLHELRQERRDALGDAVGGGLVARDAA